MVESFKTGLKTSVASLGVVALVAATTPHAHAGGFFGDIVNTVLPGVGTKLDEVHRDLHAPLNNLPPVRMVQGVRDQLVGGIQGTVNQVTEGPRNDIKATADSVKATADGVNSHMDALVDRLEALMWTFLKGLSVIVIGGGAIAFMVSLIRRTPVKQS